MTTKMHENELEIDDNQVRILLKSQCPQWADYPLMRIKSSGTDNALFRLGEDYIVRLPRLEGATENINKEFTWVPQISRFLKTPISEPIFKGRPENGYPNHWLITKWNEGHNPDFEKENEYEAFAIDLANFINELHEIKLTDSRNITMKIVICSA